MAKTPGKEMIYLIEQAAHTTHNAAHPHSLRSAANKAKTNEKPATA